MDITCVVAEKVNHVVTKRCVLREPTADEILVETSFSGISPGTELRCLAGKEVHASVFPMITGYSLVGRVLKGAGAINEGDVVFLNGTSVAPEGVQCSWGGHLSRVIATPGQAVKLPTDIDLHQASLLSMCSIAMHGVCRTHLIPGLRVLIVGQGLIGQLAAALCRISGCVVAVCDTEAARLEVSQRMGILHGYMAEATLHEKVCREFPEGFDAIIDVTGVPAAISANQSLLREKSWENPYDPSPSLTILGSYPGDIALNYQETLFARETDVITSRTYLPHELRAVIRLIAEGILDVTPLITDTLPVGEAAQAFTRLRENPTKNITIVLDWRER